MHQPSPIIWLDKKRISLNDPVYFIAEIGSNFDGDLHRAEELIWMAKESGADAAKFQHYTASTLVSDLGFKSLGSAQSHQAKWKKSVAETYDDASLNKDWTAALQETCKKAEISFFSSPYSKELVDHIDPYVPAFKLGSGDITWLEIVEHLASKKKPIFVATGASNLIDVKRAVDCILANSSDIVLMQCNTNYTASSENFQYVNLNVLKQYADLYPSIILGLSDHTPGHSTALGAVALGARVIEKHFTDSTNRQGPDHSFSMTPITFKEMVLRTQELQASLGKSEKTIENNELETVVIQRRCLRAAHDLQKGAIISRSDLNALRPCPSDGLPPYEIDSLVGKTLKKTLKAGHHIRKTDLN